MVLQVVFIVPWRRPASNLAAVPFGPTHYKAGLINGQFNGAQVFSARTVGATFPPVKGGRGGSYLSYSGQVGIYAYGTGNENYFETGLLDIPAMQTNGVFADFLTPSEAYSIDSKIDDGKPYTGKVRDKGAGLANSDPSGEASNSLPYQGCVDLNPGSQANIINAVYTVQSPNIKCRLRYNMQ